MKRITISTIITVFIFAISLFILFAFSKPKQQAGYILEHEKDILKKKKFALNCIFLVFPFQQKKWNLFPWKKFYDKDSYPTEKDCCNEMTQDSTGAAYSILLQGLSPKKEWSILACTLPFLICVIERAPHDRLGRQSAQQRLCRDLRIVCWIWPWHRSQPPPCNLCFSAGNGYVSDTLV